MAVAGIPDLWPNDLVGEPTLTPVAVLRRQAEALGSRTHNLVFGEVETRTERNGTDFEHRFVLVAPLLNFRFPLFEADHGILPYPVSLSGSRLVSRYQGQFHEATNETEFREGLREFFNSKEVKEVIRSLLAQSTESYPTDSARQAQSAIEDDSVPF